MVKFVATLEERQRVRSMQAFGIRQEAMRRLILRPRGKDQQLKPIAEKTLRAHFREDLDTGLDTAVTMVADAMFKRAISQTHPQGAVSGMFFLKCRAGWTEKHQVQFADKDGNDIKLDIDLRGLNDEELLAFNQIMTKVTITTPPAANDAEAA